MKRRVCPKDHWNYSCPGCKKCSDVGGEDEPELLRGKMDQSTFHITVGLSSHDDLRAGLGTTSTVDVVVLADTLTDAKLIACQMAAVRGRMPVSAVCTKVQLPVDFIPS